MGGVPTNWKAQVLTRQATTKKDKIVPGLYAAGRIGERIFFRLFALWQTSGEAASASVHGANRLGANSLLDLVVFGRQAAHTIGELMKPSTFNEGEGPLHHLSDAKPVDLPKNAGDRTMSRLEKLRQSSGPLLTAQIRTTMQKTMQNHASVFRDGPVLKEGVQKMLDVTKSFGDVGIKDRSLTWWRSYTFE